MEQADYYVVAAIATAVAAVVAALTFWQNMRRARDDAARDREIRAREAWVKYFELAFEHPNLALAKVTRDDELNFEKYEWYVARMLFSAEEVLILSENDDNWNAAIIDQMRYHESYIEENMGKYINHYSPAMQALMKRAFPALAMCSQDAEKDFSL